MQNFGRQSLTVGKQTEFLVGVGWQYITIINKSPLVLDANFSGSGSIGIPDWYQKDIPVPRGFTGQILLTPSNPMGLTQIVANLVYCNAWLPGELTVPTSDTLTQTSGDVISSINGQQYYVSAQGVGNSTVGVGGLVGFTPYLKYFKVTGDKSAANNTGEMNISNIGDPPGNPLYYWINQTTQGTILVSDNFDPPLAGIKNTAFNFNFPAMSNGIDLTASVLLVPNS